VNYALYIFLYSFAVETGFNTRPQIMHTTLIRCYFGPPVDLLVLLCCDI